MSIDNSRQNNAQLCCFNISHDSSDDYNDNFSNDDDNKNDTDINNSYKTTPHVHINFYSQPFGSIILIKKK